ncbi:HAMP domain-containing histidine kinase [Arthrobacter sp. I2-34]|uniref:histidine kinase n=1 Tax=Arthrobacter hankyongi TaxID=2904801 RepID=A0ABS9LDA2_9MICC|nr:HAMP domain-containing sensor histidine kinase [Arthrobacter hankyongi]MCG2624664.1 HAMP domain-containing histidine kinase [Arthrobacter hankyongi]
MTASGLSEADRRIVRAAARKVSLQIAAVCAAVVVVVVAAAVAFVVYRTMPAEAIEHGAAPGRIYLDAREGLLALVLAGTAGILLAAAVGLYSARNAVKPLGEALARQRRFVQDASHELRTPLTILDARLQLAQRKAGQDSPAADDLARLRQDSAALARLIDDLLLMSTGGGGPAAEPVDAAATVAAAVADLQLVADQTSIALASPGSAPVMVPPQLLRRMVTALVENALSHTPAGGRIRVSVRAEAGQVLISVADTGQGITGIDPGEIFDRFARGTGQGQATGSYGIGLALVREAALRHGGDVRVAHTGPDGTTIELKLPGARR